VDEIELLDVPSRCWLRVRKGHVISLTANLHVFIRRRGIKCQDFNHHYNLFVKPPKAPNIRTNMRGERKFIAVAKSQSAAASHSDSDSLDDTPPRPTKRRLQLKNLPRDVVLSDSEVEVFDGSASQQRGCKVKEEPAADRLPRPTKRQRRLSKNVLREIVLSDSEVEVFDGPASQQRKRRVKGEAFSDMELLHKRPRYVHLYKGSPSDPIDIDGASEHSSSAEPSIRSPSLSPNPFAAITPEPPLIINPWPAGVFTCDIVNGFRSMDSRIMLRDFPDIKDRFRHIFRTAYHHSTYYDARRRLRAMNQDDIDLAVDAAHTPTGLWSRLARDVPLKKTY
jgi:hypothetical protein